MRFMSASMAHLGKRLFSTRLNTAVRVDSKNRKVFVKYPDGKETSYLFLWLRDHSLAAQHRNAETKQRLTRLEELDLNVSPVNVHCDESSMSLVWPDETVSKYEFSWLRANSHEPNISCERINEHKPVYWGSELANNLPTVDYRRVMDTSDDAGLAEWLTLTEQYGISFVDNVPVTTKDTELLANRLAFIRETHYGKFWEFTSNLAHNDLAYSTSYLAGHTDTTYFTDPIGLQLFHVLHHRDGSGGKSLYVDAFNVARQMQAKFPEEYTVLQNTAIGSHAAGDGGVFMQPTPLYHTIFNHDKITDELYQVSAREPVCYKQHLLGITTQSLLAFLRIIGQSPCFWTFRSLN